MSNKIKKIFLIVFIFFTQACTNKTIIHDAHLNDGWYPQDKDKLNSLIDNFFEISKKNFNVKIDSYSIKVLIVPHAGYFYSGLCAGSGYLNLLKNKEILEKNDTINKVIILSPSHTKYFNNIALPNYTLYKTVLGEIPVDINSINILSKSELFKVESQVHNQEHAIEIQLPFLQKVIKDFKIVPLIVGDILSENYDKIVEILKNIIDQKTLIIISTDFMHYGKNHNYVPFDQDILNSIRFIDSRAIEYIINKNFNFFSRLLNDTGTTICGQSCIKILLKLFEKKYLPDLESRLACYYTSSQLEKANGDIDKFYNNLPDNQVQTSISYVSLIFTEQKLKDLDYKDQLTDYEKRSLIKFSRKILENSLKHTNSREPEHLLEPIRSLGLQTPKGAFVTLNTKDGQLRGCIGNVITENPLYITVNQMTKAAAFNDTRFNPVTKEELDNLNIDITVLTQPEPIKSYKDIILGTHGIILKKLTNYGYKSALFLPQVPEAFGWDLKTTLEQLSLKAGLGRNDWQTNCEFEVFKGFEIKE